MAGDRGWSIEDGGSRMEDRGWRIEDGGSRIEDGGSRIEDREERAVAMFDPPSSILDPRSSILDPPSSILHPRSPATRHPGHAYSPKPSRRSFPPCQSTRTRKRVSSSSFPRGPCPRRSRWTLVPCRTRAWSGPTTRIV